ncbi:mandelate racemase/muconate lactonizing enzyme family protein [Paenibacillus sp. WQ 127069]|uniref:Mandelate racemase/muconate lactonizing enzyme family protein n=1 Tax=Paenibacillus baimaensis TaxID=2982185 RepID=A0ABT2UCE2_9BACL|nr:mandelate racemase/muconate lactonizing enzyme family protein [Paenibacillus sp. WQ 127069]MCU6792298.1 mandelate racemase/muconate lactonizing enzyme family protein [Paenibacillus sp. WQ 127069]
MKITKIEVFVVKIPSIPTASPNTKRYITDDYFINEGRRSCIYSDKLETIFVKVCTDEGIEGWGELLAPTNPEVAAAVIKGHLAPLVIGENPLETQFLWDKMLDTLRERGYTGGYLVDAMAGLDVAFWDIKGKAFNLPVYMLLGGQYRDQLRCYCSSVPGRTLEERLESVDRIVEQGYDAIKIHTFGKGKTADLDMLSAIRKRYTADKLDLMLDGHGKYTHSEAFSLGRALGDLDLLFFETPLTFEDIQGHRKLADAIDTAVAVGEPLRTIYTFRDWITAGALEVAQPDLGRNGITEMMRIAHLAEAHHLAFAPHLSVHQAVGVAATVHISAAISNFLIFEYQPNALKASEQYSTASFTMNKGTIQVPTDPGLGVTIDEQELRKFVADYAVIQATQ